MAHTTTTWTTGDTITEAKLDNDAAQYDHMATDLAAGTVAVAAGSLTGTVATARLPNATKTIILSAAGAKPRTTNGCASLAWTELSSNKVMVGGLDFDSTTAEYAQWPKFTLPDGYNGGTVAVKFKWTAASGSGGVLWGIQARAFTDDDALDQAFGTAATVSDTLITANDEHVTAATTLTIAGTPAGGKSCIFQVYRNPADAADTLAVDARLTEIVIEYTTSYTD